MKKLLLVYICLLALHICTVVAKRKVHGGGGGSGGSPGGAPAEPNQHNKTNRTATRTFTPTATRPIPTMVPNNASVKDPPTVFKTTNLKGVKVFLLHPKEFDFEEPTTCAEAAKLSADTSTKRTAEAEGTQQDTVNITFGNVWPGDYVLCMKHPEDDTFYEAPQLRIQLLGEILPANSKIIGCTGQITAGQEKKDCYLETKDQQGNISGSSTETSDVKIFVIDGDGSINSHTSAVSFEKRGKYTFSFTPQKAGDQGTIRAYVRGELVNNYLLPAYTVVHTTANGTKQSHCHQEGTHTKCSVDKLDKYGNVVDTCQASCN